MGRCLILLLAIITLSHSQLHAGRETKRVKVLFTAAIIPEGFEDRRIQYIRNLKLLASYGCDVYVVESCQSGPTFLDGFCDHVCYTKSNDPSATKSVNEAVSMNIGLQYFHFDPEEMIIKITGRYVLKTNEFISMVRDHSNVDIIARVWNASDAYTGCYAIRVKYLEDLLNNHYLNQFSSLTEEECRAYAIEHGLGKYIDRMKDNLNILYWPRLYDYMPFCSSDGP